MESRSSELRRRNRRIFGLSMVVAVAVHAAIFLASPTFRADPMWEDAVKTRVPAEAEDPTATMWFVDVLFGPPQIVADDGSRWQEPPERTLEAREFNVGDLRLTTGCARQPRAVLVPAEAEVALRLNASGRVVWARVERGSGDPCRDEMVVRIANRLWYHWIPNNRFRAPVELVQPMRVRAAVD
jgi:hypothetical protein